MINSSTAYSSLDYTLRYNDIALWPEAQKKSAFVPQIGKFKLKKVLLSLAKAPAYFQKLINEVLRGLPFMFGYLDDILLYCDNTEKHLEFLRAMFNWLRMDYLDLERNKCICFKCELYYFGH